MGSALEKLWKTEDWWAVWLGLGIVILALAVFMSGGTIKGWAVTPGTWSDFSALASDLAKHFSGFLVVFLLFGAVFTISMAIMGRPIGQFIPGFVILFLGSLAIFYLAGWQVMKRLDLGAPLLALLIGLIIGNIVKLPDWFKTALRTEYYIKTGIVLLGATLPLTLIFSAGPIAFVQATIVSVCTWLTIFIAATKLFGLEPQFGAVLGAGGAVCGVSASIAVGGSVKAHKDHIAIGIGVVSIWAIVMIFTLPFVCKALVPDTITPGQAGAWVGTSEFADAAGFAVVAELSEKFGDSPINTFTLMKVIGRDIWIGIWCLVLSVVSITMWEKGDPKSDKDRVRASVIWERFPKFVIGFFVASVIMTFATTALRPATHVGVAPVKGTYKTKMKKIHYDADFSTYQVPPGYEDKLEIDLAEGVLRYKGEMTLADLDVLKQNTTSEDQVWALNNLRHKSNWFESELKSKAIVPIKKLRSWAFVICFLGIGLSTRIADLLTFGLKPFWAFTIGVLVNVPLGYVLSTIVFADYWSKI